MEHLNLTTKLLGLEDPNIDIKNVLSHQDHMEIKVKLDYKPGSCPHCNGKMIKYDFQKPSTIPLLDTQGMPTVLKLKKRRFQCKECRRVVISETPVVRKKLPDFSSRLEESHRSTYRKLDQYRHR